MRHGACSRTRLGWCVRSTSQAHLPAAVNKEGRPESPPLPSFPAFPFSHACVELAGHLRILLNFFRNHRAPQWLHRLTFPPVRLGVLTLHVLPNVCSPDSSISASAVPVSHALVCSFLLLSRCRLSTGLSVLRSCLFSLQRCLGTGDRRPGQGLPQVVGCGCVQVNVSAPWSCKSADMRSGSLHMSAP